jgi:hypothetical protein
VGAALAELDGPARLDEAPCDWSRTVRQPQAAAGRVRTSTDRRTTLDRDQGGRHCRHPQDRGPAFEGATQRAFFVARLRGGVNRSAIAAIADGTSR